MTSKAPTAMCTILIVSLAILAVVGCGVTNQPDDHSTDTGTSTTDGTTTDSEDPSDAEDESEESTEPDDDDASETSSEDPADLEDEENESAEPDDDGTTEPVELISQGTVEGRGWIGPLHYNVSGVTLGEIAVESENLHRYDRGSFFGPGIIEIWGEAHNNAHDLESSAEYSHGAMNLWVLVRYEDTAGNLHVIADSREPDEHGQKIMPRYGPGIYTFSFTAVVPDDVRQTKGRSSVMIEIRHMAAWGTGESTMAANLQFAGE